MKGIVVNRSFESIYRSLEPSWFIDSRKSLTTTESFVTTTLRPATVCGYSKRQRLDVIVNILSNLGFHNREITIFGGNQLRPNIHILDMVRAYDYLINAKEELVSGQIFNAGYENQTVNHLASLVKKVIGEDVKIKYLKTDDNKQFIFRNPVISGISWKLSASARRSTKNHQNWTIVYTVFFNFRCCFELSKGKT